MNDLNKIYSNSVIATAFATTTFAVGMIAAPQMAEPVYSKEKIEPRSYINFSSLPYKFAQAHSDIGFTPKTLLVKELLAIRNKAISSGMRLLSNDEIIQEVQNIRGERGDV